MADEQPRRRTSKPSPSQVLWWPGTSFNGLNSQSGVIVLRKGRVTFLPTDEATNLIGALAGGLAENLSPVQMISLDWLQSRPDPEQVVRDLWDERPDDFDACLAEIVK